MIRSAIQWLYLDLRIYFYISVLPFFSLCFISPKNVFAQASQNFENPIILDKSSGLDVGVISDVIEDEHGFLYISGSEGLQRFDGLNFKKYEYQEGNEYSFKIEGVSDLFYEKDKNRILISGLDYKNGHSILDLDTEKFDNEPYGNPLDSIFGQTKVDWAYRDKFEIYWFSIEENGLLKYDPISKTVESFTFSHKDSEKYLNFSTANAIRTFSPDYFNDSLIWLAGPAGFIKFNLVSNEYTRYPIDVNHGNKFGIRSILHHKNNILYLGTWGEGMFAFDPISEELVKCQIDIGTIKSQIIVSINPHSLNKIWVTTELGLFKYDIDENKVIDFWLDDVLHKKDYRIRRFNNTDNRQIAWRDDEIYIYDSLRQQVRTYDFFETTLQFIVRRVLEDRETGKLWIAAQGSKGIYSFDLVTEKWELYPPPKSVLENDPLFHAWDILQTKEGEILALDDSGIYSVSKKDKLLVPWKFDKEIKSRSYRRFIEDRRGNIWIGSKIHGLYRIDRKSNSSRHFLNELMNEEKLKPGAIMDLEEDRNGNIWIRSAGYSVYVPKADTIYNFPNFFNDFKKVIHIGSLEKDKHGDVWIGSNQQSIGITDANFPENGIVKYLDKSTGLQTKNADAIFKDNSENMWIMSNGLEKINDKNESVLNLDQSYMPKNSLWSLSRLSNGNVVIGFKRAIGIFNPETIKGHSKELQPYVHTFKVFDKSIVVDTPLIKAKNIYLKPDHNYFSFELSAINYSYSSNIEFLYKLEGVDPEWINPRERNYVSYTNLNGGKYNFNLKARKNGSNWSEMPYQLTIHIATPWYKRWWAITLGILALLALLRFVYLLDLARRRKEVETERLKEVDRFKTNFYSNITHEFRTPLTVILGMADSLKSPKLNAENSKALELIKNNGERLLRLVNEILGLAKAEKGKLSLQLLQGDIVAFIKYIGESFHVIARQNNINLTIYSEVDNLEMDFDADKMASIVSNLINNAIKFTPSTGEIILHSNRIVKNNTDVLVLKIKDNGSGLTENELPYIFNKYYQANNALNRHQETANVYNDILNSTAEGTGIGLSLTKEYVELLGGNISVESQFGIGSVFIVELPITNNAPSSFGKSISNISKPLSITKQVEAPKHSLTNPSELPLILIVEDDPGVAHYLKTCLEDKYAIRHAQDGNLGIKMALELIPDIVISDIMMPGMNGLELCDTLKNEELTDHIPIILLTAKATIEDRLIGLAQGADAYLTKPFLKEELYTRIEQLISTRKRILSKVKKSNLSDVLNSKLDSSKTKFIHKAIKIILDNLSDHNLGSAQLAQKLQLSESQIYRKIKASTNKSTAVFIRSIRLQKSRELIKSTDLSISEIAYDVGFNDPSWFSRVFKEEFGISPRSLRE